MTPTEILDKRIATATRRYAAALEDAAVRASCEKDKVDAGHPEKSYEVGNLSSLSELLKLNAKLGALFLFS